MKTNKNITEKVDYLMMQLIDCDLNTEIGIDAAKKTIKNALAEQDRETRYACAGACINARLTR
jgi:t-SNARE complex subunit (syntaxin)